MELFEKTLAVKEIFKGKVFSVHVDDIEAVKQMALAIIESFDSEMLQKIKDGYED